MPYRYTINHAFNSERGFITRERADEVPKLKRATRDALLERGYITEHYVEVQDADTTTEEA